tara:strand:- start:453 stop:704 length:252 start_codon:yes stop_codon:yes gene_type:complete
VVILATEQRDVAVTGLYLQEQNELRLNSGVLEEMVTVNVTVTVVETGTLLVEDITIQRLLVLTQVVHTLYVLVVFIDVVQENV